MSNKSGTSPQVLSLPSGGGAISGIGETFSPDLFTGTGNFSVPIELPPGRGGFAPALRLSYSTADGNGSFGLGWSISVPRIARNSARAIPHYDERDTFTLVGAEELVAVGGNKFRPRTESAFADIEKGEHGDRWRVRTKDGQTSQYGGEGAVIADPEAPKRIAAWLISTTTDAFGNRITYDYLTDGAQRYLERIRYVDDDHGRFLVSVTFAYDDRPDQCTNYRLGWALATRKRCTRIEIRTHAREDLLVRTFELEYRESLHSRVSLLAQVKCVGHDGATTQAMPPIVLDYTPFSPAERRFQPIAGEGSTLPTSSLADRSLELASLFGNGLPDLLQLADGNALVWRNLGNGRFDAPQLLDQIPAGIELGDPSVQLADLNGDGRVDLLSTRLGGYFPVSFTGGFSTQFVQYPQRPSIDFSDPETRFVDLDGDGVIDALRTGTQFELFFHDRVRGWDRVETRPRGPAEQFPDVNFSDLRVRLAALTGDGLQHIVQIDQGRIVYWPYLGHGSWGRRVTMANSPVFVDRVPLPASGFDPRRVLVGDLDGDGLADIAYIESGRVTIWINRSGTAWSDPIVVDGTPELTEIDGVRIDDVLGTGTPGILWTSQSVSGGGNPYQFLDLTGGKAHLLNRIDNRRGAVTTIHYAPSTKFYLADRSWKTALPFPVQVVERVQSADEITGNTLTTTYRYRHGYWDGVEREFRGFAMVEQIDSEDVAVTPVVTRTWFHLGPVGDEREAIEVTDEYWAGDRSQLRVAHIPKAGLRALRGSILRTELYAKDGSSLSDRPYTVTEHAYGVTEVAPDVWFPHLTAHRTTRWERGREPMTRVTFIDDRDAFGQPRSNIQIALPRDPGESPSIGLAVTEFAQRSDAEVFIADRIAREASFAILNEHSGDLDEMHRRVLDGRAARERLSECSHFYDGDAFLGLPRGQLGEHGAISRTETLAATLEQLHDGYRSGDTVSTPPELPPVLSEQVAWTDDYPEAFRSSVVPLAGYLVRQDGWFITSERRRYDAHGQVTALRDPRGNEIVIDFDEFGWMPTAVTLPGMISRATYDYRACQIAQLEDPNGNVSTCRYTPLGFVSSVAIGDQLRAHFDYVLDVVPLHVHTTRGTGEATLEEREYSDGFGRSLQTRAQTEDGVSDKRVTGWQTFDSKGRVIQTHEPYFARGWEFAPPQGAQIVPTTTVSYDPIGRVVRTVQADGSEQRVVYGIPDDLADPDRYQPTPWTTYRYDANDNAGRTHASEAAHYRDHWNTPASEDVDALERIIATTERIGSEEVVTRTSYDARGNAILVRDALGRSILRQVFDCIGRLLRSDAIDTGVRRTVYDVVGTAIEQRDQKGAIVLAAHDELGRAVKRWARDRAGEPVTLREHAIYGDRGGPPDAKSRNLLGRPWRVFDEAGLVTLERADATGNPVESVRQVLSDATILSAPGSFRVDWDPPNGTTLDDHAERLLDPRQYRTTTTYDALDRAVEVIAPKDSEGGRKTLRPHYSGAGALTRLSVDDVPLVDRISHDARGQRTLLSVGDGVTTRYEYDDATRRLKRMRSERTGGLIRDLTYTHDLVGNVVTIREQAPEVVERSFTYDARYRLRGATGREADLPLSPAPWADSVHGRDVTRTRSYRETYEYDHAGNLTALRHDAPGAQFTRMYTIADRGNRMQRMTFGGNAFDYTYDPNGNLISETSSRRFEWDHSDRMRGFQVAAADSESLRAHYLYDAAGNRVKKVVRKPGGRIESSVYIDGYFEHHDVTHGGEVHGNDMLHVSDGSARVASLRIGPAFPDDTLPGVRLTLSDYQGNSTLTVTRRGEVIDREEYTPFGETSFASFGRKRYRFAGKERDEESGFTYFGARYYAAWLGRWISSDPAGLIDGPSGYTYTCNNPLTLTDPTGLSPDVPATAPHEQWVDLDGGIQIWYDDSGVPTYAAYDGVVDFDHPLAGQGLETIEIHETVDTPGWDTQAGFQSSWGPHDVFVPHPGVDVGWAPASFVANIGVTGWNFLGSVTNLASNVVGTLASVPDKVMVGVGLARDDVDAQQMRAAVASAFPPAALPESALEALRFLRMLGRAENAERGAIIITRADRLLERGKVADHHLFPQAFEEWFERIGINIHEYTITIGHQTSHLTGLHGNGLGLLEGHWNDKWLEWIITKGQPSFDSRGAAEAAKDAFQFCGQLMDHNGLGHIPIHPYRKP